MINIDILRPYISNKVYRTIAYLFLIPLILSIIVAFGPYVLGIGIIYLAYKKINNEKIKWTFIAVITSVLLILGTFTKNEYGKVNTLENQQKSISNQDQKREAIKEEEWEQKDQKNESNEEIFLVTRVINGDTIEIEGGKRVRYIGIDTPETVDPNRPVGCFGKEASNKNSELVLNKRVKLVKDVSETDRYGRLLRYVYIDDIFVNDYLVVEGYAKASTYAPDVKYSEQFVNSERKAREEKKGFWSEACEIKPQTSSVTPNYVAPSVAPAPAIGGEAPITKNFTTTNEVSSEGVVKKSSTGICHAPGTTYYDKTKNFTPYNTVQDCLDSGEGSH
jgi:micrococcal nuclease